MQTEVGKQMRIEYDLPQELPPELTACVVRLQHVLDAIAEVRPRTHGDQDRRRSFLKRAMVCEEAAGRVLNEGVKEIYLDLAAQWRDLAIEDPLLRK